MRSPDRVTAGQIASIEAAHEREELNLIDAVKRLQNLGFTRREAYMRLEAVAVRQAMEYRRGHQA